jgi:glycosyltransferase involved in cell wall biosynthesis
VRICYINPAGAALFQHQYVQRQHWGGAEAAMVTQARALAAGGGFDVHMTIDGDHDGTQQLDGVTIHRVRGTYRDQPLGAFVDYRRRFWRALTAVDADVYVQRGVPADLYFLAALHCRARRKAYVQVLALSPLRRLETFSARGYLRWIALEQASLRLATAVVALAHDQLPALAPSVRARTQVIYEGKPHQELVRPRQFVLWVGRAAASKRPHLLIDLARMLPGERFVMAIAGPWDQPVPPNVTVHHNVPHERMDELYAGAKLVVHTSRVEGFSNVFIEAWKNGTPVVSLDVDTDGLLASRQLGRCVRAPDERRAADELREAVSSLLADRARWDLCSRNARAHARQHHDLDRQLERWRALFRGLSPPESVDRRR